MKRSLLLLLAGALGCADDPASPDASVRSDAAAANPDAARADATSPAPDGGTPLDDAGTRPDAGGGSGERCPNGSAMTHHALTALAALPALQAIDMPGLHPNTIIANAGTDGTHTIRLDVCDDGAGNPVLHSMQAIEASFEAPRLYRVDPTATAQSEEFIDTPGGQIYLLRIPPSDLVVSGLAQAIAGDTSALRIRVLGMSGTLVVGHADFVAVARGDVTANAITYTSLTVIVGGLAPGDPFSGRACPFGHQVLEETFRLGTARFELGGCSFLGGGSTTGYELHRLTIEDSSPQLMPRDRAKLVFATKAEVDAVLNYRWNHHNACDSFHLALPHADYAASSAPLAGCGEQVPNAPPRMFEEPSDSPVKYRFRYYGGPWTDAEAMGCSQYMSCD